MLRFGKQIVRRQWTIKYCIHRNGSVMDELLCKIFAVVKKLFWKLLQKLYM